MNSNTANLPPTPWQFRATSVALFALWPLLFACDAVIDVAAPQKATGTITVLDTGGPKGRTGWWPSVAFDNNDVPHLSYCDVYNADLRYATRKGQHWHTTSIISKGRVGKYTALDVDSKGAVGIAFYDQDQKYLRYAWQDDQGRWQDERVAWGVEVGMGAELRFDKDDVPHLFYYIPSAKLIHAYKPADGEWQKAPMADVTGGFSVRISPILRDNGFWVSYVDWNFKDTELHLASPTPDGFTSEFVTGKRGPGWRSQLFFEGDAPRIIYTSFRQDLSIAEKRDGKWRSARLLQFVANFAATQTAAGDVLVAYEDVGRGAVGNGTLKLLRRHEKLWKHFDVDAEGPAGQYLAIAADSQGRAVIAYYSDNIRGIKIYDEGVLGAPVESAEKVVSPNQPAATSPSENH
ncbi:MAG: hypothetical protein A2289_11195 [Deltaproteobacteria bacterium RIFOXYA12_FULL_58_15]|nr:MAG: hypothetical protein A2289_11195 [Deltaproteobacteria bacterium RIFOXYA12_FULL_58_15]